MAGWLAAWLAGWPGWLAGWDLAGWLGWLGWLAGWLLAGSLEAGDLVPRLSHARRLEGVGGFGRCFYGHHEGVLQSWFGDAVGVFCEDHGIYRTPRHWW